MTLANYRFSEINGLLNGVRKLQNKKEEKDKERVSHVLREKKETIKMSFERKTKNLIINILFSFKEKNKDIQTQLSHTLSTLQQKKCLVTVLPM